MSKPLLVEVILPLKLEGVFTYSLPKELEDAAKVGSRIVVPFGSKRLYTGIIKGFTHSLPEHIQIKNVVDVLDKQPITTEKQLKVWDWIAEYYICSLGEIYNNALPSALKLESETFVKIGPTAVEDFSLLDEYETIVYQSVLKRGIIALKELEAFIPAKKILPTVKELLDLGFVSLDEKIIEKYSPKKIPFVKLKIAEEHLPEIFQHLEKKEKQRELLMLFLAHKKNENALPKKDLTHFPQFSESALKSLIKAGVLELEYITIDRLPKPEIENKQSYDLTNEQKEAFEQLQTAFSLKKNALLHGVTGSGKTEIYIRCIDEVLKHGGSVLYLLPEIAITTQLIQRLQRRFGGKIGVYHSKLSQNERVEVWMNTLSGKYTIIIGARSAIFLPFQHLQLIIVDEEHEAMFKQQDTAPFYHARTVAFQLAKLHNARLLLGSATPSLEAFYAAQIQKELAYVTLNNRFEDTPLPEIQLIDLKEQYARGLMNGEFSNALLEAIGNALKQKKQVIIFHNRRGFSTQYQCLSCGFVPQCPHCDVTLTYHKFSHDLKCHLCGYKRALLKRCPECNSSDFETKGTGTQKLEEEIQRLFPEAKVRRMDSDTMRGKFAYERLMEQMMTRDVDILIGTQMITKGLDFPHVHLVAIPRADALLHLSDFRAKEKAFQMILQVSGRAGRRSNRGKVILQTYHPKSTIFQNIVQHDVDNFYQELLSEREKYRYPPFVRLVEITLKHKKRETSFKAADLLANQLKKGFSDEDILGPVEPEISKINNWYLHQILIKISSKYSSKKSKNFIRDCVYQIQEVFSSVKIIVLVDPV